MIRPEEITDVAQLRQVALLLQAENARLHERLATVVAQLAALQGKSPPEQLQLELTKLQEQMDKLQQKMFGRSSEKSKKQDEANQGNEQEPIPRRGHGPRQQPALPKMETRHELPDSEQECDVCGKQMEPMGEQSEDSDEITVVERKFVLVTHKRQKYRCRCNSAVKTAEGPLKLIVGGHYSLAFAVEVALQKYGYHLPLERQVKMMWNDGLVLDSQTLWDQLLALHRVLKPTYDAVLRHLISTELLHVDETRWMMMEKGGSKTWQVWALSNDDAVYYHLNRSRSAEVIKGLLGNYKGVLITDGYVAYQTLARGSPNVQLAHCMAHVRRKYLEALPAYPQCQQALDLIGKLYDIERNIPSLRGLPSGEREQALALRAEVRRFDSVPILGELHAWALSQHALPESLFAQALKYMLSLWEGLTRFAQDPRIPVDNNAIERDLRGVVVGRKNHYGSKSVLGTEVAATMYTLIETASRHGLNPRDYLRAVAEHSLRNSGEPLLPEPLRQN